MKRIVVLAALVFAACGPRITSGHVATGPMGAGGYPPDALQVRMEGQPDVAGYREIAIVEATVCNSRTPFPLVVQALKERGAALGANALLNVHVDQGQQCSHGTGVAVEYPQ
jgi:hypothetical protein